MNSERVGYKDVCELAWRQMRYEEHRLGLREREDNNGDCGKAQEALRFGDKDNSKERRYQNESKRKGSI